MKLQIATPILYVAIFSGCITNVVEQVADRYAYASGKGVSSLSFDASIYRETFNVQGGTNDTLIGHAIFSLWAHGADQANQIAQNLNLYWTVDTLHKTELITDSPVSQKELISISTMAVTVPPQTKLTISTTTNDVNVKDMKSDLNIEGTTSNITFNTRGRVTIKTTTGATNGTTTLGGSIEATTGDMNISVPSKLFESIYSKATTGNVSIRIAGGAGVTFHLATSTGKLSVSYDGVSQTSYSASMDLTVNGGGKVVSVQTTTGNISIVNY